MIARLGVSISATEVRAVLVRRGRICWHASLRCAYAENGPEAIVKLLESVPRGFGRRRTSIAIGPPWCQVKQVHGLPASTDVTMLSRVVRENDSSFFLRTVPRAAVSDVVRQKNGALWAAAYDSDIAGSAIDALRRCGFSNARVVPSIACIVLVLPPGVHRWEEDGHTVEITTAADHSIERLRRIAATGDNEKAPVVEMLAALDADGWRSTAALGAAMAPDRAEFAWRPGPDPRRVARMNHVRVVAAAVLAIVAAGAALAAPGVRASHATRAAAGELADVRQTQTEVAHAQGELRRSATTLDRLERFREQRGRTTVLLGALSQALPESTALLSLRLDTLDGSFVAITPHAADLLPQLAALSELTAPRIVGSLTKESVSGAQLERATVRFSRPRAAAPKTSSTTKGARP